MSKQLHFQFQNESNTYLEEDFLELPENSAARNFLEKFFVAQIGSMILKGPKASGKTHLLNIFAKKFSAEFLDLEKLSTLNLVDFFQADHFYILENFEEISDEELLLHLINSAREAKAFLLLSAREIKKFNLKDLQSRLKNIVVTEIFEPGKESLTQLVVNRLARKQIRPSKQMMNSILREIGGGGYVVIENYFLSNP